MRCSTKRLLELLSHPLPLLINDLPILQQISPVSQHTIVLLTAILLNVGYLENLRAVGGFGLFDYYRTLLWT